MTEHAPPLPFSVDPLIAEARRRTRRRRVVFSLAVVSALMTVWLAPRLTEILAANGTRDAGAPRGATVVGWLRATFVPNSYIPYKAGGLLTVYNGRRQIIDRIEVPSGHGFSLRLAPGRYRLRVAGCPYQTFVTVRPGRMRQDIGLYCARP